MKRKTIAKLLGAALTLVMAVTSAVRVEGGEIDVITVRDAEGNLTGVKVAE